MNLMTNSHKDLISLRGAIKNLDDLSKYSSLKINKIEKNCHYLMLR